MLSEENNKVENFLAVAPEWFSQYGFQIFKKLCVKLKLYEIFL